MLIRCSGYNAGVQEYLEEGIKNGREFTRDELDDRLILDGDLDVTTKVYQSIPDKGQDRYLTFTLAFKEDEISRETLAEITQEFKDFLMSAYQDYEYNFYAEAHIPKIKEIQDKKTGEMIERKPHIHIVIPRKNMLSGNEANPVGMYQTNEKYFEAFQEMINQKYGLQSPRENVRVNPVSASDILSRYKGDDFLPKNRAFKEGVVKDVIEKNIYNKDEFKKLVESYGETRVRNEGKSNEYFAVKLPGDSKYTNLKETIFQKDFIESRKLRKPPLEKRVIEQSIADWGTRSKELKYISKAYDKLRDKYKKANSAERKQIIESVEKKFYESYGGKNEQSIRRAGRSRNNQRGASQIAARGITSVTDSLQNVSSSSLAISQNQEKGRDDRKMLLPSDARLYVGAGNSERNTGLRRAVYGGGRGGRDAINLSSVLTADRTAGAASTGILRRRGRGRNTALTSTDVNQIYVAPKRSKKRSLKLSVPSVATLAKRRGMKVQSGFSDNPYFRIGQAPSINRVNQRTILLMGKYIPVPQQPKRSINSQPLKRSASTVPAWLLRRLENNVITPGYEKTSLRSVERDFRERRKDVMTDNRLSREDKKQLLTIMAFERLKRREQVLNGFITKEDRDMAAADIRDLLEEQSLPDYSISAGNQPDPKLSASQRFAQSFDSLKERLAKRKSAESSVELRDLYTKRGRKGRVHYIDKKTDKTLFVDNGEAIKMRRTGISKEAVGIALELAQGRFGSTLNISGSQKFKDMVVEAALEKNLDVHFTDKGMNARMAERKLEIQEQSDATITRGEPQNRNSEASTPSAKQTSLDEHQKEIDGIVKNTDFTTYNDVKSIGLKIEDNARKLVANEMNARDYNKEMKSLEKQFHLSVASERFSQEEIKQTSNIMDRFKTATQVRDLIKIGGVPAEKQLDDNINYGVEFERVEKESEEIVREFRATGTNDELTERAETAIARFEYLRTHFHEHTGRRFPASLDKKANESVEKLHGVTGQNESAHGKESNRDAVRVVSGRLIEHGAAPYQHDEANRESYYVKVETARGVRELWGQGLKDAIENGGVESGQNVKLYDMGEEETKVPVLNERGEIVKDSDGNEKWQPAIRRSWEAEPVQTVKSSGQEHGQSQRTTKQSMD